MDDFLTDILDEEMERAKARIWNRMSSKLPEREGASLKQLLDVSPLKRVQGKERLIDVLPDRPKARFSFSRRAWAVSTLSLFLAFIIVPVLRITPVASASHVTRLVVDQGEVFVNGSLVEGSVLLQEGDRVHTNEDSMAHVEFLDDSRVTLAPSTSVELSTLYANPENKAQTTVELTQLDGQVWVQVVNPVADSLFALNVPQGEVWTSQTASFDVSLADEAAQLRVARNVVNVSWDLEESYAGSVGQGVSMEITDAVDIAKLPDDLKSEEAWWSFNIAYGKDYKRQLDERYKQEAIDRATILPGNPLYVFKTFRETVQVSLTFPQQAREELIVEHAQNRLEEATALVAMGDTEGAEAVLEVYQETVEEQLSNSDNQGLLANLEEHKKEILGMEGGEEAQLLAEHVDGAAETVNSSLEEKNEVQMLSLSQKLHAVPDLIEEGEYDKALSYLQAYQEGAISILVKLEEVPLEEREALISALLEKKLGDLQMLRVIASMPEFEQVLDVDAQIYEEISMMVLALRERALSRLAEVFSSEHYDVSMYHEVYDRLRDSSDLNETLDEQFEELEEEIASIEEAAGEEDLVVEVEVVEVPVDERFLDLEEGS